MIVIANEAYASLPADSAWHSNGCRSSLDAAVLTSGPAGLGDDVRVGDLGRLLISDYLRTVADLALNKLTTVGHPVRMPPQMWGEDLVNV